MIEEYSFGNIKIDTNAYYDDVEVDWKNNVYHWDKKDNHRIAAEDVERAVSTPSVEVIIIGTGDSGVAEVSQEAKDRIKSQGIELITENTSRATETFNSKQKDGKNVVGLFHLTC